MAKINITLTSYNLGGDADEAFFDKWSAFVGRRIDAAIEGHDIDVDQHRFGEGPSEDTVVVRGESPEEDTESEVREALRSLWDDFCDLGYTLRDFAADVPGAIVGTDRGNGSAGPVRLGLAEDIDDEALDEEVTLVTEEEDPDAWYLAREAAHAASDGTGRPIEVSKVAVGERADGDNGHQAIFVG